MKLLSSEEQQVFNEQVEKLNNYKTFKTQLSITLANLLEAKNPYEYFINLSISDLFIIYSDIKGLDTNASKDCRRFSNYETFLLWTMLQKNAGGEQWQQGFGIFTVAHDLHTTSSTKNILSLLNEMKDYERIDFFQKIEYCLAAPLLVEMEPHDAAKIIDGLSSDYPIATLIKEMHSLSDSDYRTANICTALSETTIQNISPTLEHDMAVKILDKAMKAGQDHLCDALINCPDYLALVFTEWNSYKVAKFLETRDELEIIPILKQMTKNRTTEILQYFNNATTATEIDQNLWY